MNILLIEDNLDDVLLISDMLSHGASQSTYYQEKFNIMSADCLKTAKLLLSKRTLRTQFPIERQINSH